MDIAMRVVLDAAHGGVDSGQLFGEKMVPEKKLSLRLAGFVDEELQRRGDFTFMSREADVLPTKKQRWRRPGYWVPDVVVSFHFSAEVGGGEIAVRSSGGDVPEAAVNALLGFWSAVDEREGLKKRVSSGLELVLVVGVGEDALGNPLEWLLSEGGAMAVAIVNAVGSFRFSREQLEAEAADCERAFEKAREEFEVASLEVAKVQNPGAGFSEEEKEKVLLKGKEKDLAMVVARKRFLVMRSRVQDFEEEDY